jgi:hypothetical protein
MVELPPSHSDPRCCHRATTFSSAARPLIDPSRDLVAIHHPSHACCFSSLFQDLSDGGWPIEVTVYDAFGIAAGGSGSAAGLLHPFTPRGRVGYMMM